MTKPPGVGAFYSRKAVMGLVLVAVATLSIPSRADEPSSKETPMLQKMLERFPEADANNDGTLTMSEMRAYREKTGTGGPAQAPLVQGPKPTFENVSYGPDSKEVLDFWEAPSDKPAPLVVYIHGGGFSAGELHFKVRFSFSKTRANSNVSGPRSSR
jgi:acetyl esterase/lipase